jgi:hypothetical protein
MAKATNGKYLRYMPLGDVLEFYPDESWSEERKQECFFARFDSDSGSILEGVEGDFISLEEVLDRVRKYAKDDSEIPNEWGDLNKRLDLKKCKIELLETIANMSELETSLHKTSKEINKLGLLMFLLGQQVAIVNNQDLMLYGVSQIRATNAGGEATKKIKSVKGAARKLAYKNAMKSARSSGYKATESGLRMYLKSLTARYVTGVPECEEMWLADVPEKGSTFFDSQGEYSSSAVQKIRIDK